MNEQEQRIAIAELDGWGPDSHHGEPVHWHKKGGLYAKTCEELPDYLRDLNAMHEAEGCLGKHEFIAYGDRLHSRLLWAAFRATAAQRAEAFLKTLGLWKETP